MADLEFLALYPGNATITILLPNGQVQRIERVSATAIGDKCPLLWYCFGDGPANDQQASIEASSIALVVSFLRYLYTGNYLTAIQESGPFSLLHHAQLYKMAQDFDVPELQVAAHVNFMRETEISCCVPHPPLDLCAAIEFVYKHLAGQKPLIETLLNYCVFSFKYHGLGTDSGFRQLAFDIPAFHKDLCQTNLRRDFQDEGEL
ncbi:hypothetical protein K491DRAFT_589153 [Lophiostoma macrostomum CBS 122681]|uniref:BTB domain-containing protein n=1 Tax=Lophiostoma macrostomum CBS 122681 TaxID=1314788 RepID=A0A6A6TNH1_9PLEO|nr:hypothetical protein K491DRAFT_589153 [Lophiostoma macrostomum CBS 122681]